MYNESGLIAKEHGNATKVANHLTHFSNTDNVVRFLHNAEQYRLGEHRKE